MHGDDLEDPYVRGEAASPFDQNVQRCDCSSEPLVLRRCQQTCPVNFCAFQPTSDKEGSACGFYLILCDSSGCKYCALCTVYGHSIAASCKILNTPMAMPESSEKASRSSRSIMKDIVLHISGHATSFAPLSWCLASAVLSAAIPALVPYRPRANVQRKQL